MGIHFEWDKNAMAEVVDNAMKDLADERNRELQQLVRRYQGQPIEQVQAAIRSTVRGWDGSNVTDAQIAEWAELVQAGTTIVLTPSKVGL